MTWIPRWVESYGDVFTIATAVGSASVVTRPEWARQVLIEHYSRYPQKSQAYEVLRILFGNGLVTSEKEFWRQQRRLIQPAFHRNRLNQITAMMANRTMAAARRLESEASKTGAIDLVPLFSELTLDIVSRAMFGTDVEKSAASVGKHIHKLNAYALRMLRQPWLFLLPRRIPTPFNLGLVHALNSLNDIVLGIIQDRRRQPQEHNDLLAMLLSACDQDSGQCMEDQQVRDEVMTIFVAGHERGHTHFLFPLERYWLEPSRFEPDRFRADRRPDPADMIYFPFGTEPRSCIGSYFALQELTVLTAVLYRYFTFRLEPAFSVEPEPLITLRPKHGMRMVVNPRRPVAAKAS